MLSRHLSHFTPSMMSPETLEQIFVQREEVLARLVAQVEESATSEVRYYDLFIGPRGIGKTHLVSLVYHRVKAKVELRDTLAIAWLREEEYGVTSFLEFQMRILRTLSEEYPRHPVLASIGDLYGKELAEARELAGQILAEFLGNRVLLLLTENLDQTFLGLETQGQKELRAWLQNERRCTVVATAQSLFVGVIRQSEPFYGFFNLTHLEELTLDESIILLNRVALYRKDQELADFVLSAGGRARIRAIRHLARGNHRIFIIFSQFIDRDSLDHLVEPFMKTLDELTPYYQSRMYGLSPLQQKIVSTLCDYEGALTVKDLAARCFHSPQSVSTQLGKLTELGVVQAHVFGRESLYEIREPLMRIALKVKKNHDKPIDLFLDFLQIWYRPAELQQRLLTVDDAQPIEKLYLELAVARCSEPTSDPVVAQCERELQDAQARDDKHAMLEHAEALVERRGTFGDSLALAAVLVQLGRHDDAWSVLLPLVAQRRRDESGRLAGICLAFCAIQVPRLAESRKYFQEFDEFWPLDAQVQKMLALTNYVEGRLHRAKYHADKSSAAGPANSFSRLENLIATLPGRILMKAFYRSVPVDMWEQAVSCLGSTGWAEFLQVLPSLTQSARWSELPISSQMLLPVVFLMSLNSTDSQVIQDLIRSESILHVPDLGGEIITHWATFWAYVLEGCYLDPNSPEAAKADPHVRAISAYARSLELRDLMPLPQEWREIIIELFQWEVEDRLIDTPPKAAAR